jgi:hypothetical protein
MPLLWRTALRVGSLTRSFVGGLLNLTGDANSRDHWSKSKQGRATACKKLGITSYIARSIRQQHEEPSSTVLANALSAIIGAIWLDLEKQNESVSNTRIKVFSVLRRIDRVIADTTESSLSTTGGRNVPGLEGDGDIQCAMSRGVPNVLTPSETSDQNISPWNAFMLQWFNETQYATLEGTDLDFIGLHGMASELDHASLGEFQSR